jgi:hypothetical protein
VSRKLLIAAIALLALTESVVALWAPRRVATDADWQAAATEVRTGFRAGDLIVFAPAWSDQVGRKHLGDLMPIEMAARADADRFARIWQVSTRGAVAPETHGLPPRSANAHGRVTVALFEKTPVEVVYDFTTHAADGIALAGSFEPRVLEVDYKPRRGLRVDAQKTATMIEWRDVPLGSSLVGYLGLNDYYARKNGDGPVDFAIFINGEEKLCEHFTQDRGWQRVTVPTQPGTATVRVEISAPDPRWRNFGFHMEARK